MTCSDNIIMRVPSRTPRVANIVKHKSRQRHEQGMKTNSPIWAHSASKMLPYFNIHPNSPWSHVLLESLCEVWALPLPPPHTLEAPWRLTNPGRMGKMVEQGGRTVGEDGTVLGVGRTQWVSDGSRLTRETGPSNYGGCKIQIPFSDLTHVDMLHQFC